MITLVKANTLKNLSNQIIIGDPCYFTDNKHPDDLQEVAKDGSLGQEKEFSLGFLINLPSNSLGEFDTYCVVDGSKIQGMLVDFQNKLNGKCPDFDGLFSREDSIGECGVDSGTMMCLDKAVVWQGDWTRKHYEEFVCGNWKELNFNNAGDSGCVFSTTYGDGAYSTYIKVTDGKIQWLLVDFNNLVGGEEDYEEEEEDFDTWEDEDPDEINAKTEF